MVNLFVTYRCNLACPYCFARDMRDEYPADMGMESFERVLQWMRSVKLAAAAFIGGEPTLHPRLPDMLEATVDAGIAPVLFTNGLFDPDLAPALATRVANFVVNYNDPRICTSGQIDLLHANLAHLRDLGAGLTFSKNFSPRHLDYEYLLEGAQRFGVRAIRYDVSRPGPDAANEHFSLSESRRIMSHIVAFVRRCEALDIRTGLDCCIRLCDLSREDRLFLERVSMKFTGICHPSVDIHPDLSASYCLPMRHVCVPDVTAFASTDALMRHFADAVRPIRFKAMTDDCHACPDFKRVCQGGCLALKQHTPSPCAMYLRQDVEDQA